MPTYSYLRGRCSVLPGIAFSLDLIETTQQYGVSEVLLSSFMASFIFSVFGAQPLCIAGVTGPITVLNKTIFDIIERQPDAPNYLQFVGWVYLWGAIFHWITAILNCKITPLFLLEKELTIARVQFLEIRHSFLMRYLRLLRLLGIPPVRRPSHHSSIPLSVQRQRIACSYTRRCLRRHHPRPPHAHIILPLPHRVPLSTFPPTRAKVPCRLRYAYFTSSGIRHGILGTPQPSGSDYSAYRKGVHACWR